MPKYISKKFRSTCPSVEHQFCKVIGIDEVPVQVEVYENKEDELEALVLSNASREKTTEQKTREGIALGRILEVRNRNISLRNLKQNISSEVDSPSTSDNGKARDEIAKKVGFKSGRQYERAHNVLNKIDKLKEQGNTDDAELGTRMSLCSRLKIEQYYGIEDIMTATGESREAALDLVEQTR